MQFLSTSFFNLCVHYFGRSPRKAEHNVTPLFEKAFLLIFYLLCDVVLFYFSQVDNLNGEIMALQERLKTALSNRTKVKICF